MVHWETGTWGEGKVYMSELMAGLQTAPLLVKGPTGLRAPVVSFHTQPKTSYLIRLKDTGPCHTAQDAFFAARAHSWLVLRSLSPMTSGAFSTELFGNVLAREDLVSGM